MPDQASVDAAVLAQFDRDYEAESALLKQRLAALGVGLKLLKVAIVGTEDDGGDGPMFLTVMIEPTPGKEAMAPYLAIAGGANGRHH